MFNMCKDNYLREYCCRWILFWSATAQKSNNPFSDTFYWMYIQFKSAFL